MTTSANKMTGLERIGCGGFGDVFKATHDDWGVVAYKKLPQQFIKETKAVKQMAREVEILQNLRHKNIISICGVVFEEGHYGIVLEHMRYGGLDNFLSDFTVPLPYKVQLAFDVVLGVNYLHTLEKPIIHGDLKIQNVLVGEGYLAKISDFGLSSWKDMSKTSSRSTSGCPGTVTHVPPERWRDINLSRSQMEDVYAFGILLWEIFTEKTPFSNAASAMISAVVLDGQRPDPLHLPDDLPPVIRDLMDTSWHHDQSKRRPFKEIKEIVETYTSAEMKKILAARVDLQRQESSSSETSIECDGPSVPPCSTGTSLQRTSVETNHDLPIARNETGNPEVTDFSNIRVDMKKDVKADTVFVASSLCARSSGNVREDNSHVAIKQSTYEGGGVGGGKGSGSRVAAGEGGSGPRVAESGSGLGVATGGGSSPKVAAGGGSSLKVAAEGGCGPPRVAAEASLCTGEARSHLNAQLRSDLNIRPVQESNGRSIQVEESPSDPLLSNVVDLRSARTDDDHLLSETVAKNVTQPKTVDTADHVTNTAAAGILRDDAGMPPFLHSDLPSRRIFDLRSSPASLLSSHSMKSDTALMVSQETLQQDDLHSNRRLSHSQSVPEEDAILSPDTQHQPRLISEKDEQPHSVTDRALRAEKQEHNSKWNIEKSASDNNLDISQGFYPKNGGSFQKHAHPDKEQPLPAQNIFQPTVPSVPYGRALPTEPSGFAVNRPGGYSLPASMNQQMPTSQHQSNNLMANEEVGAAWNVPNRDSRPSQEAKPKSRDNSTIIVKNDDGKEVTIIHNTGSGIQIGNNNTMIINEPSSSRRKPDPGHPPAPSSSAAFFSRGSAAATAKTPVTKKIFVPDKLVDQDVIRIVEQNIGKDWKSLARQLEFRDSDIDSFFADYHHTGLKEIVHQMLRDWRERKGPEARMQILAKALVDVKRHDIALQLANKSPANSET